MSKRTIRKLTPAGVWLQRYIREEGIEWKTLAARLGVPYNHLTEISRYGYNKAKVSLAMIATIAQAIDEHLDLSEDKDAVCKNALIQSIEIMRFNLPTCRNEVIDAKFEGIMEILEES